MLRQLAILAAGAAGYLGVRHHLSWPTPQVSFAAGRWSGWMELPRNGPLIALPARVGEAPVMAVVDSGAQYSAVDADLALRLGLPSATPIPLVAFGVSGDPSLARAVRLDVDLGGMSLQGLRAATLNLQPLSSMTRQPFSLLLGRDLLGAVVVEADLPDRRAAFFRPGHWTAPSEAQAVSVREEAGGLMAPVRVEQAPPMEVLLDTGATGALALSEEAAQAAGLLDGRPVHRRQAVTLGGLGEDTMVRAASLEFAGHVVHDVDVQVYQPPAHGAAPRGLLGLGVLERFHLALDLAGTRLFLIGPERPPRSRRPERPTRF